MGKSNFQFPGIFVRGSAKNDCFEQPDAGKILPDKFENFIFRPRRNFFPKPSQTYPKTPPKYAQTSPNMSQNSRKSDPNMTKK